MGRFNYRLTSVRVEDAAGTSLTLTPTDGDFSGGAENDDNAEKTRVLNRGAFDCLVGGDDLVQEMSMTLQMKNEVLTSAAAARITDWMKKQNFYSGLVSVDPQKWAFKVIVTYNDGTTSTEKEYPYCTGMITPAEGNPTNTFALSFTNYQQPTES